MSAFLFQPSSHILQIFLRVTVQNQIRIAQRIVVDEVVQFRPLRHGHVQFILDPGAVNGNVKQKRQWTVCLPVDIPTGWEPRRNLVVRALRVAFADFSAAPWQGFEKSERGPNNSSLFQPLAAVVVVAVQVLLSAVTAKGKLLCKTKKTVDSLPPGRHSYRLGTAAESGGQGLTGCIC